MIEWVDRKSALPEAGKSVLAWGVVPSLPGTLGSKFLGETKWLYGKFDIDHSGHCGLVMVTHWAEITGPEG